jgi:ribosomal-protein-alanine N-acetyltransferase
MNLRTIPLSAAMATLAGALHAQSGLPERWTAATFLELLALPGVGGLLAHVDDEPAGLVLWRIAADEAEILTICVLPDRRRQGIGRALLDETAATLGRGGAARLFLEVAAGNGPALALYERQGFIRAGLRRAYYRTENGLVDAHILALALSSELPEVGVS